MTDTEFSSDSEDRAAAAQIAGLLDLGSDTGDDAPPADDTESDEGLELSEDDAPEETPASEDDEDEDSEPEQAILPPKSWSADEQAKFRELPPDLQSVVARRESERDKATSQKLNQVAEQRKAVEAQVAQTNQVQQHYSNTLNQLLNLTIPELQQIDQTDWQKLATDDPSEYVRRSALRDGLRQRVGYMQQQMQQAQNQQMQQLQQQRQTVLAEQYEKLTETVPEFKDTAKAQQLVKDISRTMQTYGFTPDEINGVADARMVQVMAKLAQYEKADQARKSGLAKRGAAPAPKMIPQTATQGRGKNQGQKIADQWSRLQKSNSEEDAAALIAHMI